MRKFPWVITLLVGGYIFCQVLADIGATRLVSIGNYVIPGGTFVFAVTFTLRDLIHKRLGREWARAAIVVAAGVNIIMALYLKWVSGMQTPGFIPAEVGEAWGNIFAIVPAIVVASISAEVISEWTDTEIYHRVAGRFTGKWQLTNQNIRDLMTRKKVDVKMSDKFSRETQDKFFHAALEKRGLSKYKAGSMTKETFVNKLKKEWQGLDLTKKEWGTLIDKL